VTILTAKTFDDIVYGKQRNVLIEFYGEERLQHHCIGVHPTAAAMPARQLSARLAGCRLGFVNPKTLSSSTACISAA